MLALICSESPGYSAQRPEIVTPNTKYHHHPPIRVFGEGRERVGEGGALCLVAAGGEDLLELIDDEDQPLVRSERVQRCGERVVAVRLGLA